MFHMVPMLHMAAVLSPVGQDPNFAKGKTVGVWLGSEELAALSKARSKKPEGTWCREAVVERLEREGHLKASEESEVAARAFELSRAIGPQPVREKLDELAVATARSSARKGGRK